LMTRVFWISEPDMGVSLGSRMTTGPSEANQCIDHSIFSANGHELLGIKSAA